MLQEIHFIVTYMCNFECDHCFLYCSPNSVGTYTISQVKNVLNEIKKIETIETVGFEGGEPFLFYPLVLESIKLAGAQGLKTAIQTNSYWATTVEDAELWLKPFSECGLSNLEVSDDTFHHDEELENSAKRAMAAARKVDLEVNSICINQPTIQESPEHLKGKPIYLGGPKLRGRAITKLSAGLPTRPWNEFTECVLEDLRNPSRVHIDAFGNVHLCQGLSMGNMWTTPLSELVKDYNPDTHPICGPILRGGPAGLAREYDIPHEDEYVDACHFCSEICVALIDRFPQYLTPKQVYGLENIASLVD
ncbi:radical SAM protein [candidate division CSSED10-310 bacterium]|uniref:Radical SAM protein n=1 Tax=candidate division CSSED10-310 bacterium TaxID=2855610 RepID=A0ABV6Z4E8_UNCC1